MSQALLAREVAASSLGAALLSTSQLTLSLFVVLLACFSFEFCFRPRLKSRSSAHSDEPALTEIPALAKFSLALWLVET